MDPLLFFKSLADDTRLKILLLISHEQELCVCELTQALDLSQPKVSRHMALLRRDGLLVDRREGKWVFYRLASTLTDWQKTTLTDCLRNELGKLEVDNFAETLAGFNLAEALLKLSNMGNRPTRQQACCT